MSEPVDVLLVAGLAPMADQRLSAAYRVHRADPGATLAPELAAKIRAVVSGGVAQDALLAQLPKLEIVSTVSVGYDGIGLKTCLARGIPIANTPEVLNDDVADLAIALMLMTSRRLSYADRYVRDGKWLKAHMPMTHRVSRKKLGIVGLGRIGRDIASRAEAMHMQIAYHNRRPVEGAPYRYVPTLVELARESDFLVLIIAAGPDATKMVNQEVMEALGPEGILINISRGHVVDEQALIGALKSGKLGGAGLDVFEDEPRVPAELLTMDNVVLTPHVGSRTVETRTDMGMLALDNLDAWFAGKPLLTEIPESQAARRVAK